MHDLFDNRPFRRLFAGRLVTNAGDSLYYVAAMWLVYQLGGSSFYTGLAGFLTLTPQALQFLTGPLVDRWRLRPLLVATQVAQGLLILVIPLAAWTGRLHVWVILVVMPVVAMLNQFVYPAQTAALPRIVAREDLVEANSLFSFAYQGVDLVFSATGGILVALLGAVTLYLVDSVTFAVTALLFLGVRVPPAAGNDAAPDGTPAAADGGTSDPARGLRAALADYRANLHEGVRYVRASRLLVFVTAGSVLVNGTIGATMAVFPAFAGLRGGPGAYGLLLATIVGGMLVGALVAAPLKRHRMGVLSAVGFSLGGCLWLAGVTTHLLPLTGALFALAWIPVGVTNVIFMAFVQSVVPEHLLGRVTSLVGSASTAAMPLGSLLGGLAGDALGSTLVVTAVGVGFLLIAAFWALHPMLRGLPPAADVDPAAYGLATGE